MALFGILGGLIVIASAVWVIYDLVKFQHKNMSDTKRIIWIISAIIFNILAAIAYYFLVKLKK